MAKGSHRPPHILINRGNCDEQASARVTEALDAAGIGGMVELIEGHAIASRAGTAVADGAELLIIGGGDGSVSAAAGALADTRTRLGILPMGTLNHFARDLGIPFELDEAARLIASGPERRVDVGTIGNRIFVNNVAIGLYPLMLVDREAQQQRLGRSKRLAMLVASLRTMRHFHAQRLVLSVDGDSARTDTPLLFVGNNDYRLALPGAGRRDRLDDGKLCVLVLRKKGIPGFLAAVARALAGRPREDDMIRLDDVESLRVETRQTRLTLAIDGEIAELGPPLDFRIRKQVLRVIAP